MHLDESAILWSTPERDRSTRPLIVLLHGYASHEGDLFSLSPRLPLGATVASVRAPIPESGGFAWWGREGASPGEPPGSAVDAAAFAVIHWLDGLEYTSIALVGFSQGAALSLQLNRHAPGRFAATVALAGFIAPGGHAGDAELAHTRPPIFWGRGTADVVIPPDAVERTAAWLPAHSTATVRIYEDLAHSISTEELSDFTAFLGAHL